jgi:hypothetical protein
MKKMVLVGLLAVLALSVVVLGSYILPRPTVDGFGGTPRWSPGCGTYMCFHKPVPADVLREAGYTAPPNASDDPAICFTTEEDCECYSNPETGPTCCSSSHASGSASTGVSELDLINDENAQQEREEDTTPPGATTVPDGYYPEAY